MRTSQRDFLTLGEGASKSAFRKENLPFFPSSPASTVISFSTISPNSPHHHSQVLQNQWMNRTAQPFGNRGNSPKPMTHPPVIELGGSKEKRVSRQKAVSNCSTETQGNEGASAQGLLRKVIMLQNRVKELHLQKQHLGVELNKRLHGLEIENQRLISIIKDYQNCKGAGREENEFNLEEELSNQININLELREQLQELTLQLNATKLRQTNLAAQISNLGEEKADLKLQLLQLQDSFADQSTALQQQLRMLQQSADKKDANFTQILEEKEKRILELEEQLYSGERKLEEKESQNAKLNLEVLNLERGQVTAKQEVQFLHKKVAELEKPSQCKKCKDLLHTVFRLNSQLNKKQ